MPRPCCLTPRPRFALLVSLALCAVAPLGEAQDSSKDAPKIVERSPDHLDCEVDAKKVTQLVVTFDRPMNAGGFSFTGGGPGVPKFQSRPKWKNATTVVAEVELEPDHEYEFGLNSASVQNFRSAEGVPLVPVRWSFATLPEKLLKPAEQKARNQKALDAMKDALEESYSYYDLRVKDWPKLFREHTPKLLAARTDRSWVAAAARMLEPTQDIHLGIRLGERRFGVTSRSVDPLYRDNLLAKYLTLKPVGKRAACGTTADGIGYLMIGAWSEEVDLDAVERALAELRGTKAMVVDVRPNGGGDELMARRIAAWFVQGQKAYAKHRIRTGPGKDGFAPVSSRVITGNGDDAKRYDKPVAVLTSRYVLSSNESFVMMMEQAKDCTTVGQTTGGSSGCPKSHELPNGVVLVLPSWVDLRLDETCLEGEGLKPDFEVAVTDDDLRERDPILEHALEILRKKTK